MQRDLADGPAILYWSPTSQPRDRDLKRTQFATLGEALQYVLDGIGDVRRTARIETPNGEILSEEIKSTLNSNVARGERVRRAPALQV